MSETTPIPIAMVVAIALATGILAYMIERPNKPTDHDGTAATHDSPLSTAVLLAEAQTGAHAIEAHVAAEMGAAVVEVKLLQGGVAERVVVNGQTGRVVELRDAPAGP